METTKFIVQEEVDKSYLLEPKVLVKFRKVVDIVDRSSIRSCCFTKAYGHYYEGTSRSRGKMRYCIAFFYDFNALF